MAIIKHGNNALANVTAFPSAVSTGKPVLISTATASSSASIEFTSGIDSTYDIYQFEFVNIHPVVMPQNLNYKVLLMVVLIIILQRHQLILELSMMKQTVAILY